MCKFEATKNITNYLDQSGFLPELHITQNLLILMVIKDVLITKAIITENALKI
jgi:hypothetical protein